MHLQFQLPLAVALASLSAASPLTPACEEVQNWLYTSEVDKATISLLDRPDIAGVQTLYNWKSLEPQRNQYDFSAIHRDLAIARSKGKQLWVQLQDRTFSIDSVPVPEYLHKPRFNNGSVPQCDGDDCDAHFQAGGWVTAQWNKHVRTRYQALLKAMADSLDGQIYGMNLPETSIDVRHADNYTCRGYFDAELDNAKYAASVFRKSFVVQYVNFWPCGYANAHNYLSDSFAFYAEHGVGVGGPDDIPYKTTMENNAYPFMSEYRNKVPITVVAVQEPDLAAINPNTTKKFTKEEFTDFAVNRLGVKIMFWAISSLWLHE